MNQPLSLPPAGAPLPHFVAEGVFDPQQADKLTKAQERVYLASQLTLMWWKFRKHRLALASGIFLILLYASILISEFLAPYNYQTRHTDFIRTPPQSVHLFHEGQFIGPFTYGLNATLDMSNLKRNYSENTQQIFPVRFFCRGDSYRFWGLFEGDLHLVCPGEGGTLFLLGTDRLGRDMLSRIIFGARISLTIGLIGIAVSFTLGIVIGGLAGYYGGLFDLLVQRTIEVVQSLPTIPLWLALSAIMPPSWSPILVYFGITVILGLMDWTGLARAVRSKLLSLREDDYVVAAQLMGAGTPRVVFRHLVPGFMSHLIASATIAIPSMILGETALSFLGLGLRPPITSWGVMLNEAQNINIVVLYPWLILPVVPVIAVILAFNFLGDGLRDAADPYR
ncbi:peptide/nickel transport system permease protein [Ancylobacter sp. 3268]|uniref:ABC transporter permease n=1 Tax=Ancylobacter sp. 3268 TaxID=2817752 RepID=UPI002862A855|nr:ABC transporter permease [Ancylobacter sp. 3268]MDR6951013.1 peptide/nickel transport system permease protein [Ancylobacter sp. 3268]